MSGSGEIRHGQSNRTERCECRRNLRAESTGEDQKQLKDQPWCEARREIAQGMAKQNPRVSSRVLVCLSIPQHVYWDSDIRPQDWPIEIGEL